MVEDENEDVENAVKDCVYCVMPAVLLPYRINHQQIALRPFVSAKKQKDIDTPMLLFLYWTRIFYDALIWHDCHFGVI